MNPHYYLELPLIYGRHGQPPLPPRGAVTLVQAGGIIHALAKVRAELLTAGKTRTDWGCAMIPTKSLAQRLADMSRNSAMPGKESLAQRLANIYRDSPQSRLVSGQAKANAASKRFTAIVEEAMAFNLKTSSFWEK